MADAAEVRVTAGEVDLASGLLWAAGVTAVAEEVQPDGAVVLRVDLPAGGVGALVEAVGDRWAVEVVSVDDGLEGWREHARVVRAGPVVVRPPWVPLGPIAPGEVVVEIDPGASFGHGAHPTTRLCLAALARLLGDPSVGDSLANRRADTCPASESTANPRHRGAGTGAVLDVGCGSGVLAIASVLLGARSAVGIDIDPAAVEATRANAEHNGVADRVRARLVDPTTDATVAPTTDPTGSASTDPTGSASTDPTVGATIEPPATDFDVVVANLGAAALRSMATDLVAHLAPGGTLVLSGLLDPPPPELAALFAPLAVVADERTDGWTCLGLR